MVKPSLGPSESSRTRWMRMGLLSRTKQGWLLKGSDKRKGLTMMKPLPLLQDLKPSGFFLHMLPIWVSWYLKETPNLDRKSTSGGCQILGGKLVCWSEKKQSSVSMSSNKAEPSFTRLVAELGMLNIKKEVPDKKKALKYSGNSGTLRSGLNYSKNYVSVPSKEIVRAGLETLGLVDENNPTLSSTSLVNSSLLRMKYFFTDLEGSYAI
ncbi:hypothetical protein Tco_1382976 [Tanacetum coccineum]